MMSHLRGSPAVSGGSVHPGASASVDDSHSDQSRVALGIWEALGRRLQVGRQQIAPQQFASWQCSSFCSAHAQERLDCVWAIQNIESKDWRRNGDTHHKPPGVVPIVMLMHRRA